MVNERLMGARRAMISPRRPCLVRNCARAQGPIATGGDFAKSVCDSALSRDHAVWVPAFAGTTCGESRIQLSNSDADATPHSRGANSTRALIHFVPSKTEGAGKTGCTLHPRSRVQSAQKKRTRAYRFSGNTPAFPAQWLYGLLRALPGERLSCHRHP